MIRARSNISEALQERLIAWLEAAGAAVGRRIAALRDEHRNGSGPDRLGRLSLALQGGGSYGAFTWGVLDRLLEDGRLDFDGISGASAGAVNAVVMASGLAHGGRDGARAALARFWRRISEAAALTPFGGAGARVGLMPAVTSSASQAFASAAAVAIDLSSRFFSPYQSNPLGVDPLRRLLAEEVDFAAVRAAGSPRLFVAATRVADGMPRIFGNEEITLDSVVASACLPLMHHAVEIDGEWYWDGGYSANPALDPLVTACTADDLLVVQLTPGEREGLPKLSADIVRRLNQIAFNGPLRREMEMLARLKEMAMQSPLSRSPLSRRLRRLRLHHIAAEHEAAAEIAARSALDVDWAFLTALRDRGREAADTWLAGTERG